MTIDVVVYISSVANPRRHPRKIACLESFAEGVTKTGHHVHVEWDFKYRPGRLAVMLGWATTNTGGPNIALRKQIIAEQQQHNFKTMCIDASCWKYLDDSGIYLRYSLGGPFYDRAEYANKDSGSEKWQEISQRLSLQLNPPGVNNGHILICMQRDGGFSMKSLNPNQWLDAKIKEIRLHTTRAIVVRPHPNAYMMQNFNKFTLPKYKAKWDVSVIDPKHSKLTDNLVGAHSVVLFNSSASVAAVCAGIPVFADDSSCVSWAVANKNVSSIESPMIFDRQQWIQDLAAAHWSDEDARAGKIYQKFLPYLT
jgi:hypothetical protein